MIPKLAILYRGPLSSCNYGCAYCPFAKHFESTEELQADRRGLARFVGWAKEHSQVELSILFTPWGEALIRKWYRDAVTLLTNLPHVSKVAVQTNLSCALDWINAADKTKLGLWATYHPGEAMRARFVEKCRWLTTAGVGFSVGVVGLKEHQSEIEALRRELPPDVYVWINAYKRELGYYTPDLLAAYTEVDPLFPVNTQNHASAGHACRAGHTVISVDGEGTARRCHFIKTPIGNVYDPGFLDTLAPEPSACTNATCGCHIGYIHLPHLRMYEVYGEGILERIPSSHHKGRQS